MKGFLKVLTLLFLCLMLMMPAAYAVENSNSQTFPDVPSEHKFFAYIEAIYAAGITTGYSDGEFKPLVNVDRGQMAAFLARALELDISNPPATPSFPDVQPDWQFYAYVEAIYEAGITTGYSDGEYKPYEIVSRGQMAAFIARALNLLDGFDVPTESSFPDVSPDFQFFPYIEAIYAEGITTGYSDGTYRPYEPVTRGQMAAFLARAFGLAYVVDFSVFESIHSTLTQNAAIAVPIEGAVIDVFTDSARTEKNLLGSATTDENGEATLFFKLSNGTYYYEATADGYEDKIGDFAVLDADKLVDIEMTTTLPPFVSATIDPVAADYDLYAPADVVTTITWNDATAFVSVEHDGLGPLVENTDYEVTDLNGTATLAILDDYFDALVPPLEEGDVLDFVISFDFGTSATLTVTVVDTLLYSESITLNDGNDLEITVTDVGDWIEWCFDFPVEVWTGDGKIALGLVIAKDGLAEGPAFQIHNNDGTDSKFDWGTWLYSPWGPTITDGWYGWNSADDNTLVTDLAWVEASGERDAQGTDGKLCVRILKSELGSSFHWAARPTVGTGWNSPVITEYLATPAVFDWAEPLVGADNYHELTLE